MKDRLILGTTAFLAKTKGCVGLNKTNDYVPMYKILDTKEENEDWTEEIVLSEGQGEDDCRENYALAITQGLLQTWLRETHDIHVIAIPFAFDSLDENSKTVYCYMTNKKHFYAFINKDYDNEYETYEEAFEAGLVEALHLLENV